jgi:hypothetical protein
VTRQTFKSSYSAAGLPFLYVNNLTTIEEYIIGLENVDRSATTNREVSGVAVIYSSREQAMP